MFTMSSHGVHRMSIFRRTDQNTGPATKNKKTIQLRPQVPIVTELSAMFVPRMTLTFPRGGRLGCQCAEAAEHRRCKPCVAFLPCSEVNGKIAMRSGLGWDAGPFISSPWFLHCLDRKEDLGKPAGGARKIRRSFGLKTRASDHPRGQDP